jgi:hypothetical protein
MHIDIIVPYEPYKQLAFAYNRSVEISRGDWILFLDYDVMILNHKFYDVCMSVISKLPKTAGWVTCRTNRLGPLTAVHQLCLDAPPSDDLNEHTIFSKTLYENYQDDVIDITALAKRIPLSGFFILTPREVAKKIQFRGEILGCDNNYCNDLIANGYSIHMIPGLYAFHRRKREWTT